MKVNLNKIGKLPGDGFIKARGKQSELKLILRKSILTSARKCREKDSHRAEVGRAGHRQNRSRSPHRGTQRTRTCRSRSPHRVVQVKLKAKRNFVPQFRVTLPNHRDVCMFFNSRRGCRDGDRCRFRHGQHASRAARPSKEKREKAKLIKKQEPSGSLGSVLGASALADLLKSGDEKSVTTAALFVQKLNQATP